LHKSSSFSNYRLYIGKANKNFNSEFSKKNVTNIEISEIDKKKIIIKISKLMSLK